MQESLFFQLSFILILTTVISLIFRILRQPLITGYLVTGFVVGPSAFNLISDHHAFESFSQIGIVLLLFIIGLGLNASVIKSTGKPVLITFMSIIAGVSVASFAICSLFGLSMSEVILVTVALLFSSTIIVVKSLTDKKEQSRLYSQIAIGILLVEDIAATIALLMLSATSGDSLTLGAFGILVLKGIALAAGLTTMGMYVVPRFTKLVAQSQELLYLFALAWGFGVASVFQWAGFSIEVGALFAGVSLAHVPYAQEISTRLKPLRDFFVVLFFIDLGGKIGIDNISSAIVPALLFSVIIMVVKPLMIMLSLGRLGYTKQTSFKTAVHLSQISEFSIILIVLAQSVNSVSSHVTVVITLTAVITIIVSTYLMNYDDALYRRFQHALSFFERTDTKREVRALKHYPLVLLGYRKGGHDYVTTFRSMRKRYVVIDFDPGVAETLERQRINHIYGDATDLELLDEIGIHKSELIVSTITDPETNHILLDHLMQQNPDAIFICHANSYDEAELLYAKGAAYVLLPHFIGSERVNTFIRHNGSDKAAFDKYRKHHLSTLNKAISTP